MDLKISRTISVFYWVLLFFVPIVLFPTTSELFEFNKTVLTYALTTIIVSLWIVRSIFAKRLIFTRSLLDIPILIFLAAQVLSTVTSIDLRTSIFGYYSRFNGGLLTSFSYALLYWAYVSNVNRKYNIKAMYVLIVSAVFVSIYGVLQHLGVDSHIWVQDVQKRIFSTLGQPNWLAAWIVAIIPLTWAFAIRGSKLKLLNTQIKNLVFWISLSILFFLILLFTGSRSGLVGFVVADITFWLIAALMLRKKPTKNKISTGKAFVVNHAIFVFIILLVGTQWTPKIQDILSKPSATQIEKPVQVSGTALAIGGSSSTEIRKIVWQGSYDIWKNYPILGTGVETFAYSYYNFRPIEHNLVSEWDFLYNKAHNEYLNIAATTGTVGLVAYLFLLVMILVQIIKEIRRNNYSNYIIPTSLLAGFSSILVTNFFGFSVVPVSLLMFMFPAFAVTLHKLKSETETTKSNNLTFGQKSTAILVIFLAIYIVFLISKYWYADYLYSNGKVQNDSGNPLQAIEILETAIDLSPSESIFWEEESNASLEIALALEEEGNLELALAMSEQAIKESNRAINLSPKNVNLLRKRASMFIKLSIFEPNYLLNARNTLLSAIQLAPTDAKLYYNLALAHVRIGDIESAISVLENTIKMKKNYGNARLALALLLIDEGDIQRAKEELTYILEKIDPDDKIAQQELKELNEK